MLTPKQIIIFEAFMRRPFQCLTYQEIKHFAREKSNSVIQKAVVGFLADNLITKQKIGNIFLYHLNLDNSVVFSYFDVLIHENWSKVVQASLDIVRREMGVVCFSSIVVFGSYAEGRQTKESDLDVAIFVGSIEDKEKALLLSKSCELKSLIPLDIHVFTQVEMLEMLKDKKENLGKQIACKHMVIQSPVVFYSILQEGIQNGFKVVY